MSETDGRVWTERSHGVWATCDQCGHDWWCVVTDRDYLDEPTEWGCSGGCDDGWPEDDGWDYDYLYHEASEPTA